MLDARDALEALRIAFYSADPDETISDTILKRRLIACLPPRYDAIVEALRARGGVKQHSIDHLLGVLRNSSGERDLATAADSISGRDYAQRAHEWRPKGTARGFGPRKGGGQDRAP